MKLSDGKRTASNDNNSNNYGSSSLKHYPEVDWTYVNGYMTLKGAGFKTQCILALSAKHYIIFHW